MTEQTEVAQTVPFVPLFQFVPFIALSAVQNLIFASPARIIKFSLAELLQSNRQNKILKYSKAAWPV
jgi:hypothetical protein